MNDFYDIGGKDESQNEPMQLNDLGDQRVMAIVGKQRRNDWGEREHTSKTFYTATKPEDYDRQFASRIYRTNPPYAVERLLDHHYNHYSQRFPDSEKTFFKHLKYVIIPILQKGKHDVYVELVNEWLEEKKNISAKANPSTIPPTLNEKLDKILEFLVANAIRINVNPHTIHEEIFEKNITFQEAQDLHRKLLVSGKVRVIGHRYIGHSVNTSTFLQQGGFSNNKSTNPKPDTIIPKPNLTMSSISNPQEQGEVFISYSWDNKEHEGKVLSFTEHLLQNGFHAEIDKMISQRQTATNFTKMMFEAMQYDKVVVVLSEGYKKKADGFKGGVGQEFELLINDITRKPRKYIFVSFNGRSDEIIPFGLMGRDIIDLSDPEGLNQLYRKLMDQSEFVFSEVNPEKPKLEPITIGEFRPVKPEKLISIEVPLIKTGNTASFGGKYKSVEFTFTPRFKNISGKTIEGFAYEIVIKREMAPEHYDAPSENGYLNFNEAIQQKIYPNILHTGKVINIKIAAHVLQQILNSTITITAFTDSGHHSEVFKVEELFKLKPSGNPYGEAQLLNRDLFI
jgi:hypothetical protein